MALRIIGKRWNNSEDQVITHVKVEGQGIFPMIGVWNFINEEREECYTFEKGKRAVVYARQRRDGVKYLTSHTDGVTENNLDELPDC